MNPTQDRAREAERVSLQEELEGLRCQVEDARREATSDPFRPRHQQTNAACDRKADRCGEELVAARDEAFLVQRHLKESLQSMENRARVAESVAAAAHRSLQERIPGDSGHGKRIASGPPEAISGVQVQDGPADDLDDALIALQQDKVQTLQ